MEKQKSNEVLGVKIGGLSERGVSEKIINGCRILILMTMVSCEDKECPVELDKNKIENNGGSAGSSSETEYAEAGSAGGIEDQDCVNQGLPCKKIPGVCAVLKVERDCSGLCKLSSGQVMPLKYSNVESGDLCGDGLDNDCDGYKDQNDPDCK